MSDAGERRFQSQSKPEAETDAQALLLSELSGYKEALLAAIQQSRITLSPPSLAEQFEKTITEKFDTLLRQIRQLRPGRHAFTIQEVPYIISQVKKGIYFDTNPETPSAQRLGFDGLFFDREVN